MRILIMGASGMLGHKLLQELGRRHDVAGTVREANLTVFARLSAPDCHIFEGVRAGDENSIEGVLDAFRPSVAVNCIGIVKQLETASLPEPAIAVNALFPHQLGRICGSRGIRLIQFSTDCVFSGEKGAPYAESDVPDARDLYGLTKFLGEISGPGLLTLRTSIIGRELRDGHSLIEWAISQRGRRIRGYVNALYSGFPTLEMAHIVERVLLRSPAIDGLWQVASQPISKFELLGLVNRAYRLDLKIERDEEFCSDRRLDGSRFNRAIDYAAPPWEELVGAMVADAPL